MCGRHTAEEAPTQTSVDFVELYNPGNFTANKGELIAGTVIDCKLKHSLTDKLDIVNGDMCRWAMTLDKDTPWRGAVKCVKKPAKDNAFTHLSKLLQARYNGQHEHQRLEGSSRTKQAE